MQRLKLINRLSFLQESPDQPTPSYHEGNLAVNIQGQTELEPDEGRGGSGLVQSQRTSHRDCEENSGECFFLRLLSSSNRSLKFDDMN